MLGMESEVPLGQPLRSSSGVSHGSASNLSLHSHGEANTLEFRIKAADKSGKKTISLWHDVTLVHVDPATDRPTPYLNFVSKEMTDLCCHVLKILWILGKEKRIPKLQMLPILQLFQAVCGNKKKEKSKLPLLPFFSK